MQLPTLTLEQLLILYCINQVSSALVQALPTPVEGGNAGYVFFYKFFTLLVGDFKSFSAKLPALNTVQITSPTGSVTTVNTAPTTPSAVSSTEL
jgi:hypothetical protein